MSVAESSPLQRRGRQSFPWSLHDTGKKLFVITFSSYRCVTSSLSPWKVSSAPSLRISVLHRRKTGGETICTPSSQHTRIVDKEVLTFAPTQQTHRELYKSKEVRSSESHSKTSPHPSDNENNTTCQLSPSSTKNRTKMPQSQGNQDRDRPSGYPPKKCKLKKGDTKKTTPAAFCPPPLLRLF